MKKSGGGDIGEIVGGVYSRHGLCILWALVGRPWVACWVMEFYDGDVGSSALR